jgi:hypothetical protein
MRRKIWCDRWKRKYFGLAWQVNKTYIYSEDGYQTSTGPIGPQPFSEAGTLRRPYPKIGYFWRRLLKAPASINRFYEAGKRDRLGKSKWLLPSIAQHFRRLLDFVPAFINIWALPPKIICAVVIAPWCIQLLRSLGLTLTVGQSK